jgi:hypothetical protein
LDRASYQEGQTSAMLQSHLHSLIAKAHRYQAEPERFERVSQEPLRVAVHGANGDHEVVLRDGRLQCDCDGFAHRGEGICAHVLGVEHHFRDQVPPNAVTWPFATPAS